MTINQISVFLENRPGQLANICRTLANANISIVTLSLADTAEFGIVRMIVSDHDKAKEVLKKAGHVANMREVVAVTVPDRPGGMAEIKGLRRTRRRRTPRARLQVRPRRGEVNDIHQHALQLFRHIS